jgi:para-nitrobenzyl esterase
MKHVLGALALTLFAGVAHAQQPPAGGHAPALLTQALPAPAKLTVTSPSFKDGGDLPFENTQYRGNHFPGLTWTKGPAATKSYVVVMQGELGRGTSLHLTLFNLAPETTTLPVDMKAAPAGAMFGENVHGPNDPYSGPHTHDFVKQRYQFQVFALDTRMPDSVTGKVADLTAAMQGHVLANGAIVALATMDPDSKEAEELRAKRAAAAAAPKP